MIYRSPRTGRPGPCPIDPDPRAFVVALQAGDPGRATAIAAAMVDAATPLGRQWHSIARFAATEGEWPVALAAMARFVADAPQDPARRLALALMQTEAGRVAEAVTTLTPLVAAQPNDAQLRHFLGVALIETGQREAGIEHLRAALTALPTSGATWLAFANAARFTSGNADYCWLAESGTAVQSAPAAERAGWLYAHGKALDDLGDHDRAFAAFADGAALIATARPYDVARDQREALATLDAARRASSTETSAATGSTPARAIFVTGKPRSGTTLVDQILNAHSAVTGGGEINLMPLALRRPGPPAAIRTRYHDLLAARFGRDGRIIDKSLNTSRVAGAVRGVLPDAPMIWIERDALDTAWSSYRTLFSRGVEWSFDLVSMAQYHAIEDALRAFWVDAYGPRLLPLRYADLVDNPDVTIDRLLAHAGLSVEDQVHRFHDSDRAVQTASVAQVRRPINRDGIGSAAPYAKHLAPYERAYAEARKKLGLPV